MPSPHTCSSSNRASIVLAAIEQARMVLVMGNPSPHVHDTRHRMEVPLLLHQKSDATSTHSGFWLKEEEAPFLPCRGEKNVLSLCLPCLDQAILNLENTQGF